MTEPAGGSPIDPGLLARFHDAERRIAWRPAGGTARRTKGRTARIAHLNEEEARVESWESGTGGGLRVDSGPLGALLLVLEIDRRGPPRALGAHEAGRAPRFPSGALVAAWDDSPVPHDARPRIADLVELARYALA